MKFRIISLFLVFCLFVAITGCGKEDVTSVNTSETESADYSDSLKIGFYKDGLFNFNIVRPADMNEVQIGIIKNTVFKVARLYNQKRPNYITDKDDLNTGLKNIYVGNTNSKISQEAYKKLTSRPNNHYDYIIMMKNGDIAINAISEEALKIALDYFCNNILTGIDSTIPENYLRYYAPTDDSNLKINNIGIKSFAIQCEDAPSGMVMRACEELQSAIKDICDFEIPIFCGDNHSYQNIILAERGGDDKYAYSLKINGNKVNIKGGHDYSLGAAIHEFAMNLKQLKVKKGKEVNIPKDYSFNGIYDKDTVGTDGYKLVFIEEWDGYSLNDEIWFCDIYENLERGHQRTNKNIKFEDGIATFWADKTILSDGTQGYSGVDLNGRGIQFAYGYYEIRCQVPKGSGAWPGFWAVGDRHTRDMYFAEIDVFEFFGTDNRPTPQLHTWWNAGRAVKGLLAGEEQIAQGHIQHLNGSSDSAVSFNSGLYYEKEGLSDGFHTYACEWTPAYMKFYCDGYCYRTVDLKSQLVDPTYGYRVSEYLAFCDGDPVRMMIGVSLNDRADFIKPVSDTTVYPAEFKVDYISLYQMDNLGTLTFNHEKIERYGIFEDEK